MTLAICKFALATSCCRFGSRKYKTTQSEALRKFTTDRNHPVTPFRQKNPPKLFDRANHATNMHILKTTTATATTVPQTSGMRPTHAHMFCLHNVTSAPQAENTLRGNQPTTDNKHKKHAHPPQQRDTGWSSVYMPPVHVYNAVLWYAYRGDMFHVQYACARNSDSSSSSSRTETLRRRRRRFLGSFRAPPR